MPTSSRKVCRGADTRAEGELVVPTIDELIDRVRALESELNVERGHRISAELHADACDQKLRALLAPVGWSGAERRRGRSLAKWDGLERRVQRR